MLDPEGGPADPAGEPAPATEPITGTNPAPGTEPIPAAGLVPATKPLNDPPPATVSGSSDWPAIGYWVAIGARTGSGAPDGSAPAAVAPGATPEAGWSPEPPPPTWTRTYELPTARRIVSSGLQLAVASSRAIRSASIYIGLLALGAFGPLVILLLLGIGRLMSNPETTATFAGDPTLLFFEQPALAGLLGFVYVLLILGGLLLVAISIDAQAIAIALLAGTASERPLRLREAVARARQTFWRLLGTGLLVGLASGLISIVIAFPFLRPLETNEGVTFVASMIGTLVVVPFAFASTGIVLGDVGGMEALRRSVALVKARPRIAVVVVLFTLVTSAIETFALGAGADVAIRVGEFLHLGLDQGPVGLILPTVLVLGFIVAFGSLTFTIAAIVAAPQVTGFLGLTFFSGGLDRARTVDGAGPQARWVTLPMLASMVILAIVGAAGLQAVYAFEPRAASPALAFLRTSAQAHDWLVSPSGEPLVVEDPLGDHAPGAVSAVDILAADMAGLYYIPEWLVEDVFTCGKTGVACDEGIGSGSAELDSGGYLFVQRMAAAPLQAAGGGHREWGPMVRVYGPGAATEATGRFAGANYRFSTELDGDQLRMRGYRYGTGGWREIGTTARSAWQGDLLVTFVPVNDLPSDPTAWDTYASAPDVLAPGDDNIRSADGKVIEIEDLPWIDFLSNDFFGPGFSFDPDFSFPPDFPFEP